MDTQVDYDSGRKPNSIRLIKDLTEEMNAIRSSKRKSILVIRSTSISIGVSESNTSSSVRSMVGDHCEMRRKN